VEVWRIEGEVGCGTSARRQECGGILQNSKSTSVERQSWKDAYLLESFLTRLFIFFKATVGATEPLPPC
jgi:hypothetical protein